MATFARNELAILGTNCSNINKLAQWIMGALPAYRIGYADADHSAEAGNDGMPHRAEVLFSDKIAYTRVEYARPFNAIQQRHCFNDTDLVLVNGNHFIASRQIIVIDDAKPLHKKLSKLTHVVLVLLAGNATGVPEDISSQLPELLTVPVLSVEDKEGLVHFVENWMQQRKPVLNGLVLSGGQSTRMGMDKGEIRYHAHKTQRQYVYELLKPLCNEVFVSCNAAQATAVAEQGLPVITDSFMDMGPLGGILSAFRHTPDAAWLVVACDLPYLSAITLGILVAERDAFRMATAFWDPEGGNWPEPLTTIWEPASYSWLLQLLAQGYTSPREALINANIALLPTPDKKELLNVNEYNDYVTTSHELNEPDNR
ncbi:molybdenum cofactor guanylyltransferase [Filimonas lacunae]|uniref:Probable molybdenum cofactor guanylyltransferase n=1 Tax=Filimonas lacunae TaxID=477680 RepID=A0A173MDM4_9BACT|nr:NTP transferase domain-containing protein [Filimonas lacunae]BAV05665.1 molybdopterin-guanine dinucleotide biosynthesis protein [Filimonas lacunae]SIT28984.1 molybdenum cofactor guanylyltransferase [Filimonas lacunae]